ncbi:MAG: NUDIX domain-containing protein [Deinococcota bacterium]
MTSYPLATVGALAVSDDNLILLIRSHKWRDMWCVPGGKIDYGESMVAALKREFVEETGLKLAEVYWAPTLEAVNSPEFHKPAHFILLNFIARVHGAANDIPVTLNDEAQTYAWLTVDEALDYDLNSFTRSLVIFYRDHQRELVPATVSA